MRIDRAAAERRTIRIGRFTPVPGAGLALDSQT